MDGISSGEVTRASRAMAQPSCTGATTKAW